MGQKEVCGGHSGRGCKNVKVWGACISDGSKWGLWRGELSERSGPLECLSPPPFPQGAPAASKNIAQHGKVGQFLEKPLDLMIILG